MELGASEVVHVSVMLANVKTNSSIFSLFVFINIMISTVLIFLARGDSVKHAVLIHMLPLYIGLSIPAMIYGYYGLAIPFRIRKALRSDESLRSKPRQPLQPLDFPAMSANPFWSNPIAPIFCSGLAIVSAISNLWDQGKYGTFAERYKIRTPEMILGRHFEPPLFADMEILGVQISSALSIATLVLVTGGCSYFLIRTAPHRAARRMFERKHGVSLSVPNYVQRELLFPFSDDQITAGDIRQKA